MKQIKLHLKRWCRTLLCIGLSAFPPAASAAAGDAFADVESVKAVSDVYSPVSGRVVAVNEELLDTPQRINEAPYEAWMIRVEVETPPQGLLSEKEYAKALEEEA